MKQEEFTGGRKPGPRHSSPLQLTNCLRAYYAPGSMGTQRQAQPRDPAGEERAVRHTSSHHDGGRDTQQRRYFGGSRREMELDVSRAGLWRAGRIWAHGAAGKW